jgi:hypothetical protein
MTTWKNLRIRTLIEENQEHAALRKCAGLLEQGHFKSNISHRVSVEDLIDAYKQEASPSSGLLKNIAGVNELLSALRSTEETYLRLVTLKADNEDTVVFTDSNLNQVVGALRILRHSRTIPEKQPESLTEDQEFYHAMGEEVGPQVCREASCARLRVSGSVRCRSHLFEMVKGRTYKPRKPRAISLRMADPKDGKAGKKKLVSVASTPS